MSPSTAGSDAPLIVWDALQDPSPVSVAPRDPLRSTANYRRRSPGALFLAAPVRGVPSLDPIYPLGPNRQVPTRNNHVCALTTSDRSAAEESLSISSMPTALPAWRN